MPGWLRNSLVAAAILGGVFLLWVGFALLVAVLLIIAIPLSIWSIFARRGATRAVTIEGSAKRVDDGTLFPVGGERENQQPPK